MEKKVFDVSLMFFWRFKVGRFLFCSSLLLEATDADMQMNTNNNPMRDILLQSYIGITASNEQKRGAEEKDLTPFLNY